MIKLDQNSYIVLIILENIIKFQRQNGTSNPINKMLKASFELNNPCDETCDESCRIWDENVMTFNFGSLDVSNDDKVRKLRYLYSSKRLLVIPLNNIK